MSPDLLADMITQWVAKEKKNNNIELQVSPDLLANMITQWVAKEKKNAFGAR